MNILITNDDGIDAPGLLALVDGVRNLGDVYVVAPDRNWSASGHVKTLSRPIQVSPRKLADGTPALATDGAPSDCVALALKGIIPAKIDLVVSGINPGMNIGHDVTYSGTVTAAIEAAIVEIPAIAFSLDSPHLGKNDIDFSPYIPYVEKISQMVIQKTIPAKKFLSVNFPYRPEGNFKGIKATTQGYRIYRDELLTQHDPYGNPYYWIGGLPPIAADVNGTEGTAVKEGYISITPYQLDFTDKGLLNEINGWDFN
jgi:5'-nucleotidase